MALHGSAWLGVILEGIVEEYMYFLNLKSCFAVSGLSSSKRPFFFLFFLFFSFLVLMLCTPETDRSTGELAARTVYNRKNEKKESKEGEWMGWDGGEEVVFVHTIPQHIPKSMSSKQEKKRKRIKERKMRTSDDADILLFFCCCIVSHRVEGSFLRFDRTSELGM